jgi:D-3-phosphoglycerate dehydrogenase
MLMLNLLYGLQATQSILAANKPRPPSEQLHARMMKGKTVGIVGFGKIGREVARRLVPFEARLLVHSPHADPAQVPAGLELVDFETLMRSSDVVGLFMAITAANRGLIDEGALRMMKPTAYLVNVARGAAIDEPALILALQERRIAGAALDTFAIEPLPADSPLRLLDNVILTPHSVGHTRELFESTRSAVVENIRRLLTGALPLYCKNPEIEATWRNRISEMATPYQFSAQPR